MEGQRGWKGRGEGRGRSRMNEGKYGSADDSHVAQRMQRMNASQPVDRRLEKISMEDTWKVIVRQPLDGGQV